MSEVIDGSAGVKAGNTNETLTPTTVLPSASDLDAVAEEKRIADATSVSSAESAQVIDEILDEENSFDVSRAEYNELRDAFLRLFERIEKFNIGAPHKI